MSLSELLDLAVKGNRKALARLITMIENQSEGVKEILSSLTYESTTKVVGITGPPGAGKSTLTDALVAKMVKESQHVAVLCVDPSSPFSAGAILGDRIRMQRWYNAPTVYIRSLASRGSLGGIGPMTFEITDLLRAMSFDMIIIETVGVGQSEVEIVGLADVTTVVLVPESGDDIQTMKSGLLEIADIFVINKCDRPGAERLKQSLLASMQVLPYQLQRPVIETTATEEKGIEDWLNQIIQISTNGQNEKKSKILAEKAWQLIAKEKMKKIDKKKLLAYIEKNAGHNNLYNIVDYFTSQ